MAKDPFKSVSFRLNLEKQDCPIAGAILTDADDRFLKWYYLGKKA